MNTYPLNQNPIPQAPMMPGAVDQHHRFINISIVAIASALIIGILYWWTTSSQSDVTVMKGESDIRAQVAAILREAPAQATQQEIDNVTSRLSASKVTVSSAEKQAVVNAFQAK